MGHSEKKALSLEREVSVEKTPRNAHPGTLRTAYTEKHSLPLFEMLIFSNPD